MKLNFRYRFEAAHRLSLSPDSSCATPHGHTWFTTLHLTTVQPRLNAQDMVVDFADLKAQWKQFVDQTLDHSFFCNSKDPLIEPLRKIHPESRLLLLPGDPTTELLSLLFYNKAKVMTEASPFKDLVRVSGVTVEETPTNSLCCDTSFYSELIDQYQSTKGWWSDVDPLNRGFLAGNTSNL